VKSGDTLYAIAKRYNTTVDALVRANNLPEPEVILNIGQKLTLPANAG
jgi:LysM repeat protein